MKGLLFGFIGIFVVLASSLSGGFETYLQEHSLVIVVGGTFVILFISTPSLVIKSLVRSLKMMFKKEKNFFDFKRELLQLSENKNAEFVSKNSLITYAQELWQQGTDSELFISLISQKRAELESRSVDAVQALKNLAKYPPALGMMGTVMGMIALFNDLDNNKGNIGQNLALAMTATFFGLLLTNALISPLADRIHVQFVNEKRLYTAIYQVLLLINRNEPFQIVAGELEEKLAG